MPTENSSPRTDPPPAPGPEGAAESAGGVAGSPRKNTRLLAILGAIAVYLFLALWLRPEMAGPLSGPLTDLHDSVSDRFRKHPDHLIDLNTASPAELQQLPGIGPVMAAQIIRFREQSGPIRRPEDLLALPRMTRRVLDRIRPYILVNGTQ